MTTITPLDTEFKRGLGLYASTMVVVGSMIGSGIFLVSAEMGRQTASPGLLLTAWIVTGGLTLAAALSYGELAAMMPRAGGQYVYLREAFGPLWGFLYGWTLFMVIQTGTIAAVAVGFARYTGYLLPWFSETHYLISPIHLSPGYAVSLSTVQLLAIVMVALLTWTNTRGLDWGKVIQNVFTTTKTGALLALIAVGLLFGVERCGDERELRATCGRRAARRRSPPGSTPPRPTACSSRCAWRRSDRSSPPMRGTTSRSRPVKSKSRVATSRSRSRSAPVSSLRCTCWPTSPTS